MLACPEQSVLARFIDGTLDAERREAVATHLDRCADCLEVAAASASVGESVGPADPGVALRPLARGDSVGRYLLVERIGAGAFGEVFSAYDPKLDRKLAIKIGRTGLLGGSAHPDQEARALREAQALAQLSHPNVVAVHDVGTVDGRLFIAMEHIDGETLAQWRQRAQPDWSAARDVYVAAARGLAAAHAAGFVHRDFKPANVMLGPAGRVRVLDFGLVRPDRHPQARTGAPRDRGPDTTVTRTGSLMGTPAYMAPEQERGEPVDARADQFALCVSLWECIFGGRPPRTEAGLDLRPRGAKVVPPGWLVRALQRGLASDPAERFADVEALLAALSHDRTRRRHWRWAAAGALLSALAATAVVTLREPEATAEVADGVAQTVRAARDAAARAYYVYPAADGDDRSTAYFHVLALEAMADVGDRGEEAARALRSEFADTLVRLGDDYYEAPGGRPFSLDYYAAALVFVPDHARASARAAVTPGELAALRQRAETGSFSAPELAASRALVVLAEPDPSVRDEKINTLLAAETPVSHSTRARLEDLRSPGAAQQRRPTAPKSPTPTPSPEAISTGTGAEPVPAEPVPAVAPPPSSDPKRARQLVAAAKAARRAGKFERAESLFHQALAAAPRAAGAARGLAELHHELGRYGKALPFAKSAARAHPKDAGLQRLLGDLYNRALRYGDARKAYERAVALGDKTAAARLRQLDARTAGG
ncbi:MAG: protein kinase [Myxococcota bacterium]